MLYYTVYHSSPRCAWQVCSPDGPVRGRPPRGQTPLIAAAAAGHVGCARRLLEARAQLRAMTQAHTSAAHLAAARADVDLLRLLLQPVGAAGIATWARDSDQRLGASLRWAVARQTILHLAARLGEACHASSLWCAPRRTPAREGCEMEAFLQVNYHELG